MIDNKNQCIARVNDAINNDFKKSQTPVLSAAIFVAQYDEDTDEYALTMSVLRSWIKDEFGKKQLINFDNYILAKGHKLERVHQKPQDTTTQIEDTTTQKTEIEKPLEIIPLEEIVADDERFLYENVVVETPKQSQSQPTYQAKIQPKARSNKPQPKKR